MAKQLLRIVLVRMATYSGVSASATCTDFAGTWEVYREPAPFSGEQRVTITQHGCNVTVYDKEYPGFHRYAHYHAKGNVLACRSDEVLYMKSGIEGPGTYCREHVVNASDSSSNYASWPTTFSFHEALSSDKQPTMTGTGTYHGMGLIRLYTTACPTQYTDCYRHWAGSWKDSLRNFTLAQDGCHVTRKYMMFILSWIEVVENYTACGNRLVGETEVLGTNIKHPDGPVVLAEGRAHRAASHVPVNSWLSSARLDPADTSSSETSPSNLLASRRTSHRLRRWLKAAML